MLAAHRRPDSVIHAGGRGTAKMWRDEDAYVCEIGDAGVITDLLADRTGHSSEHGSVVRLGMRTVEAPR